MTLFLNTGLTQQQFLDEYWQKKPLLIRQAVDNFYSNVSPEELIDLACEDDIEARLIQQDPQDEWHLKDDDLTAEDFRCLPETHWTVLVQDMDKHRPDLQDLFNPFQFIPDWRRDDLMISYAPKHGSVGPHVDSYDVFLLQVEGLRRWEISDHPIHNPELMDNQDLRILKNFRADLSWELAPGDCLYLPPHFAHHGVALESSMTYSFGFRSPSKVELLDRLIETLLEHEGGQERYADPNLLAVEQTHEINLQAIQDVKRFLGTILNKDDSMIIQSLGRLVTETKPSLSIKSESNVCESINLEECLKLFNQGMLLKSSMYHRFAWSHYDQSILLFCAGETYSLDDREHAIILCESNTITLKQWNQLADNEISIAVMYELISEGAWIWSRP